jgi:hypothetical protein
MVGREVTLFPKEAIGERSECAAFGRNGRDVASPCREDRRAGRALEGAGRTEVAPDLRGRPVRPAIPIECGAHRSTADIVNRGIG